MAAIRQALIACPRTTEALAALKSARGTADAARELGVSIRTFQRVVNEAMGRSPAWWRRLARVRRVAAKIASIQARQDSLVEMAVDAGFSDQAHMTRELQHWLGTTPGQLRRGGPVAEALKARGYE
nr:helix-turn-helix domain-containing protein [Erythrobacter sp. SN021]